MSIYADIFTSSGGGGGGGGVKFTQFTTSGTFTKQATTKMIQLIMWSGGAGAGSGAVYAINGVQGSAGGSGGAAQGMVNILVPASAFASSESVTVGAGGTGGAAISTNSTSGNNGTNGGDSIVGNISTSTTLYPGYCYGLGGQTFPSGASNTGFNLSSEYALNNTSAGNGGLGPNDPVQNGVDQPQLGTAGNAFIYPGVGGGGGGIDPNGAGGENGGRGGNFLNYLASQTIILNGGAGGIYGGAVNGSNGNTGGLAITSGGLMVGGSGGGGGASSITGNAGNGGNGGVPGAGGGGGGAALNGTGHSGAGGNGARGEVWIYEFS
jgi:hypothetical protein